ncbi:MAG: hypothetical protein ACJ71T_03285 [Actinomycetales bacterium]
MTAKTRIYSLAAAAWAGFYVVLYVLTVRRQGNDPAWWYVTLVCAPLALSVAAGVEGATPRAGKALLVALVLFVFSALLGVASIGLLLVPSVVAAAVAAGAIGREPAAR